MDRRAFISSLLPLMLFSHPASAFAADPTFDSLIQEIADDPTIIEDSWLFENRSASRGVGTGKRSDRAVSDRALDMIRRLEISSPQQYERRYRNPIWPKGESGVTIGIGYDLRFANRQMLERDWGSALSKSDLDLLGTVLTLGGQEARDALPSVRSVDIPWDAAKAQFDDFIHYPTAQAEGIFANSHKLSDDSFGALVSLVYNRGPAIPKGSDSRREMYQIHLLMQSGTPDDFLAIPAQIRSMKRLWTTPESRGLPIRRELEARLFEEGL